MISRITVLRHLIYAKTKPRKGTVSARHARGVRQSHVDSYPNSSGFLIDLSGNLARSSLPSIQTSAESLQPLPAKFLQLPISQGRINQGSKSKPNIVAHIATVISNRFRDRACEVVLSHTEDRPHPANTECHHSCYPNGQFLLLVPITPDESGLHLSAEYELLFESDRNPKNNP